MDKIHTEHGIFTVNEELGLTAEEVYQKWLENKDKPKPKTQLEILQETVDMLVLDNLGVL